MIELTALDFSNGLKSEEGKVNYRRQALYVAQSATCHYCKDYFPIENWTIDHKTPLSRGGSNAFGNLVGACRKCNGDKDNLTEEEYAEVIRLRALPTRPNYLIHRVRNSLMDMAILEVENICK